MILATQNRVLAGRYEIRQALGEGRTGQAALAWDRQTRQQKAIKLIDVSGRRYPLETVLRFRAEAETLRSLQHNSIIRYEDFFEENQISGLVMEYFPAPTLRDLLQKEAPLSPQALFELLRLLADGLAYVHERGLVHHDLKPANILARLEDGGWQGLRILDFGLSHLIGAQSGLHAGTLTYMSPEQTGMLHKLIDHRADLYALGVILYEAATGEPPFQHSDPGRLMHLHVAGEAQPPRQKNQQLPVALEQIILKLLHKDPDDRYRTTGGLLRDLDRLQRLGLHSADFQPGEQDHWESFPRLSPFVGRARELHDAEQFLCNAGAARLLLIESVAGGGRSRFLDELYNRVSPGEGSRWQLRIRREETRLPFRMTGNLISRVANFLRSRPAEMQAQMLEMIQSELGDRFGFLLELAPDLKTWLSETPASARPWVEDDYRFVLGHFLAGAVAKDGGLILFLDDMHNADLDSLKLLLELLGGSLAQQNIRVVATLTASELTPGMRRLIDGAPAGSLLQLHLDSLTDQETGEFLQRTFSGKLDDSETLLEILNHYANGNPLLLRSILQESTDRGIVRFEGGVWICEHAALQALIHEQHHGRDEALPELFTRREVEALRRAAIFQRAFTLDALYHLTNPQESHCLADSCCEADLKDLFPDRVALLNMLDRAIHAGVLSADSRKLYAFTSPHLRSHLKQEMPLTLRQRSHGRVAHFLEREVLPQSREAIYDIAYHLEQSDDLESAARTAVQAARLTDDGRHTNRQSQHYYNVALRCLEKLDPGQRDEELFFEVRNAALQHNLNIDPRRADIIQEMDCLERMAGEHVGRRIEILNMRAQLASYSGDRVAMVRYSEEAIQLGGGRPEFEEMLLHTLVNLGSSPTGKSYAERAELLRQAVEIARRRQKLAQSPIAVAVYPIMLCYLGKLDEARAFVAQITSSLEGQDRVDLPVALFAAAGVAAEVGDFSGISESLGLERLAEFQVSDAGRRFALAHGARALGVLGRTREALQCFEMLFSADVAPGTRGELAIAFHGRIWMALIQEDPETALEFVERGLNHLRLRPDAFMESTLLYLCAHAALDLSEPDLAEDRLNSARQLAQELRSPLLDAHIELAWSRLTSYRVRSEASTAALEAALEAIGQIGASGWHAIYRQMLRNWRLQGSDSSSQSLRLRTENRELFQLIDLSRKISSTLDFDQLMEETLKGAMSLAGAQQGYLFLCRSDSAAGGGVIADLRFARDAAGHPVNRERLSYSPGVVDAVLESRSSVLLRDARSEARWRDDPAVREHELRSILATPVLLRDRPLGLIYLDNRQASSVFTLHDREITETFATQAAIAIHNARLFEAEQQARQRTENTLRIFERFIPRQFTQRFAGGELERLERGLSRRERLGVLFSDLRDFTSISEKLSPEETFALLNDYLDRMEAAVRRHGGFVDKFIGDAVMALFDEHPVNALRAGADMLRELALLNEERVASGLPALRAGIGVHWGEATLGVVGSRDRLDTTAVGDVVNTASRLESLTKSYGTPLLLSGAVSEELPAGEFDLRFLDMVMVKGKDEPIAIYETLNQLSVEDRNRRQKAESDFTAARNLYLVGDFAAAQHAFAAYCAAHPDDLPASVFLERSGEFLRTAPANWDGIFRLSAK
ncbi:MAG: protein kinase [Leptospirales bacterium]|nr:protein kinase [Leptospirales bacterium]